MIRTVLCADLPVRGDVYEIVLGRTTSKGVAT
jgi:hypothetical protein